MEDRLAPANHTWTGAVSNLWSNNGNWTGGAPTPTSDPSASLFFPAGASNLTNVNDITGASISDMTYSGSGYTTTGNPITLTGLQTITSDPTVTGANTFNPNIGVGIGTVTVNVANNAATLTLGGVLSETMFSNLNITGAGTLVLTGSNTYSGGTTLKSGTLAVGSNTAVGTGSLTLASGTTLQAAGGARVLNNALFINGDVTISGTNDLTFTGGTTLGASSFGVPLTVTVTNTGFTTFSGSLAADVSLPPTSFIKAGPGTLILSGSGTFAIPTVVSAGTLLVNGMLPAVDITVSSGATLGGSGSVRTISASGTVRPGGPSTAVFQSGNATFAAGSSFAVKLNGTAVGSAYDQLSVTGTVDLSAGPTLSVAPGFAAATGNTFTIITSSGPITGTFTGLAPNSFLTAGGQVFQISYTPNSVVLARTMSPTTATLASSANPSVFGQSVSFTATIAANSPGIGTPMGTVQFQIDGTNFGGPVSLTNGVATSGAISTLSVGAHTVMVVYSGDPNFLSSNRTLAQTVNRANTSATVSSSVNPSVFGQSVTFTATIGVTAPGAGTPTGTVQFQIDGSNVGSPVSVRTTGGVTTASFSTTSLGAGPHTVAASYSGDVSFAASTAASVVQTVNRANTLISITSSANPSTSGQPVTFTAVVQAIAPGNGVPTGIVTFQDQGTLLGMAALPGTANASITVTNLASGTHSIIASYNGGSNFNSSTSSALIQTVTALPTVPTTPIQAFVIALYRTVLERSPDTSGFNFWVQQLQMGVSRAVVALGFELSVEHRVLEVNRFYELILRRPADAAGQATWVNALVGGQSEAAVVVAFLISPEYTATHRDNTSFISGVYQDVLNHPGDAAGLAFWLDLLQRGVESRAQIALSFLGATEAFQQAIDFYYTNFLGRPSDPAGAQGFLDALQRGRLTSTSISTIFLASDEFLARAIRLVGG